MRPLERLLVFLGVCLPVPVLAATGLSVPLPGTVERMATRLVPFSEPAALASGGVAGGSIVLTDAERRQARDRQVVQRVRLVAQPAAAPSARRLTRRPAEPTRTGGRTDDVDSTPIESRVAPEPAPVALPPLTPPGRESKPGRGPKLKPRPAHERKPRHEPKPKPRPKPKPKPKHEPPPTAKTHPAPPPKREPKPQPPRPPKEPADEPQPPSLGAGAEQDNGEDGGKASAPERRQSP